MKHTERDLELLIEDKLNNCSNFPYICNFSTTHEGKKRILERVKQVVFNDGITDLMAAIGKVEQELAWDVPSE